MYSTVLMVSLCGPVYILLIWLRVCAWCDQAKGLDGRVFMDLLASVLPSRSEIGSPSSEASRDRDGASSSSSSSSLSHDASYLSQDDPIASRAMLIEV